MEVKKVSKIDKCFECESEKLIHDYYSGEIVCGDCGLVLYEQMISRGLERRAFTKEEREKRSRVGAPTSYSVHDKGLTTTIGRNSYDDFDAYGREIGPKQKAEIYRIRKWQNRLRVNDYIERNLSFALVEIHTIGNHLNLPLNVLETASIIYRKALKDRLIQGRSIKGITSAAVYAACRQCRVMRTLEEIAQASDIDKKEVGCSYRLLVKELNYYVPPFEPSQFITKYSDQLMMGRKTEEVVHKILNVARDINLTSGKEPGSFPAAAIYIASILTGERRTQNEIAKATRYTEVTIRNRSKDLEEKLMFNVYL